MNIMTKDRKVYMCTQSSNYWPNSIPSLLHRKSIASFILYPYRSLITGARYVQIFFYYIMQGEQLTCLHFLSGRVKLIVTSERLNIHKNMLPPVESQVIFLSKETPIVSVDLRTVELHESKQNGVKIEVEQMMG